jgi:arabinogalactan endo-1,4-beta-galactosidase
VKPSYALGADISWVQQLEDGGATFKDTDGIKKDIFAILKNHGFNYIRLRTFVDPTAADGYSTQGYCDIAHTATFAKRIKAAGMGFVLDFHYSDNWADPGKQCVPIAWQGKTAAQMAQAVHDYTQNSIQTLATAGLTPDMIQVGNEITPGMLIHVCDNTGTPTGTNPVNGSTSNWTNLASFLNAGIQGAHAVDPNIKIIIHIDRGGDAASSIQWVQNLQSHNVPFDVFGESCYVAYQGQPSAWQNTFDMLNTKFPYATNKFQFSIQEYGPDEQQANDIIFGYANDRGFGTFIWEPDKSGAWGPGLFTVAGNVYTATSDMLLYDQMKVSYASRL